MEIQKKINKRLQQSIIFDINVEKGEFVAILGKNGSGKSSLAKHINGLLMPTEGTVYIKGMDTKDESTLLKSQTECRNRISESR